MCDLLAKLRSRDIQSILALLPSNEEVFALMYRNVIQFDSLTFIEFAYLCQACSRMGSINVKFIRAFFTHFYNRQWRKASYRCTQPDSFLTHLHDEEFITREEDVIWKGDEIECIRVSEYSVDGSRLLYEGMWKNKKYHGHGTLFIDSVQYNSAFTKQPIELNYEFASVYKGEFENGKLNGWGTLYDAQGLLLSEGDFVDNRRHGRCSLYRNGNLVFRGMIQNTLIQDAKEDWFENSRFKSDISRVEMLYGDQVEEYNHFGLLTYRGSYRNNQPYGEGFVYRSPHYLQEVRNYGDLNRDENGAIQYQSIPDCRLEDVFEDGRICFTYEQANMKPLVDPLTKVLTPFLESKAYLCSPTGWR